jgi:hypothetical protein
MITPSNLISSTSAFVEIIPSGIIVNLIELGASMITHGHQQDLKLDPGSYSIDLDRNTFDANVMFQIKFFNLFFNYLFLEMEIFILLSNLWFIRFSTI